MHIHTVNISEVMLIEMQLIGYAHILLRKLCSRHYDVLYYFYEKSFNIFQHTCSLSTALTAKFKKIHYTQIYFKIQRKETLIK